MNTDPPRAALSMNFLDGFDDDTVIVEVNGKEVMREEAVSYSMLMAYSHTFETEIEAGTATIEVSVPTRDLVAAKKVDASDRVLLHVSIANGRLVMETIGRDMMDQVAFF